MILIKYQIKNFEDNKFRKFNLIYVYRIFIFVDELIILSIYVHKKNI